MLDSGLKFWRTIRTAKGPPQRFGTFVNLGGSVSGSSFPWDGKAGYLGFKFTSHSKSYFGWAKMAFNVGGSSAKLTEYAYDTVPGQTIDAGQTSSVPEPGTLSLLALGAVGLLALRKRRQVSGVRG